MSPLLLALAATLAQGETVRQIRDLAYVEGPDADPRKQKLDLYMPSGARSAPVLMWIHGGAWKIGDRSWYRGMGLRFAEAGVGFAAISYRLSPGVKHPAHVQDCAAALAWLRAHVAEHGGNPERLFVSGQSAGGHLTALLALNPKYLDEAKVPRDAIKGSIPMSGVYRITAGLLPEVFGSDPQTLADASPIQFVKNASAPMLVITEKNDSFRLRPTMQAFKRALEEAGVTTVEFRDAPDRDHISIVVNLARKDDPQLAAMIEFIKKRCDELDKK
jgi:acetyl esterase/lipase